MQNKEKIIIYQINIDPIQSKFDLQKNSINANIDIILKSESKINVSFFVQA